MELRLPVTGTTLRYIHASKRRLERELKSEGMNLGDLGAMPLEAGTRLIQAGRWFEEEMPPEQADAIIDAETEGGVAFAVLVNALIQAFHGRRPTLEVSAPEPEEALTLVTEAATPKKSRANGSGSHEVT